MNAQNESEVAPKKSDRTTMRLIDRCCRSEEKRLKDVAQVASRLPSRAKRQARRDSGSRSGQAGQARRRVCVDARIRHRRFRVSRHLSGLRKSVPAYRSAAFGATSSCIDERKPANHLVNSAAASHGSRSFELPSNSISELPVRRSIAMTASGRGCARSFHAASAISCRSPATAMRNAVPTHIARAPEFFGV